MGGIFLTCFLTHMPKPAVSCALLVPFSLGRRWQDYRVLNTFTRNSLYYLYYFMAGSPTRCCLFTLDRHWFFWGRPGRPGHNINLTISFLCAASRAWRAARFPIDVTTANDPTFFGKTAVIHAIDNAELQCMFYTPKGSQLQILVVSLTITRLVSTEHLITELSLHLLRQMHMG